MSSPWFWALVGATLLGSVSGQLRGIALSTCVTLLVPEDRRDRANGLVGSVMGVSFAITSVFSGLVIGTLGMGWAYVITLSLTLAALVDLFTIDVPEPRIVRDPSSSSPIVDVAEPSRRSRQCPGSRC